VLNADEIDAMFSLVSHELKEPIRGVGTLSQFLQEDCAAVMPERGLSYLETLDRTVERMQRLVSGLNDYARAGQGRGTRQSVVLSHQVERVRDQMQPYLLERQGGVLVDPRLPTVQGDPVALALVFRHLIENGLKFNTCSQPRVEVVNIPGDASDLFCSIAIRDNGIGIDSRNLKRIFDLFQRLHRYEDYPGAGVGLAIARRIVAMHGGTLEVDSKPGEGSTFRIRIPSSG